MLILIIRKTYMNKVALERWHFPNNYITLVDQIKHCVHPVYLICSLVWIVFISYLIKPSQDQYSA